MNHPQGPRHSTPGYPHSNFQRFGDFNRACQYPYDRSWYPIGKQRMPAERPHFNFYDPYYFGLRVPDHRVGYDYYDSDLNLDSRDTCINEEHYFPTSRSQLFTASPKTLIRNNCFRDGQNASENKMGLEMTRVIQRPMSEEQEVKDLRVTWRSREAPNSPNHLSFAKSRKTLPPGEQSNILNLSYLGHKENTGSNASEVQYSQRAYVEQQPTSQKYPHHSEDLTNASKNLVHSSNRSSCFASSENSQDLYQMNERVSYHNDICQSKLTNARQDQEVGLDLSISVKKANNKSELDCGNKVQSLSNFPLTTGPLIYDDEFYHTCLRNESNLHSDSNAYAPESPRLCLQGPPGTFGHGEDSYMFQEVNTNTHNAVSVGAILDDQGPLSMINNNQSLPYWPHHLGEIYGENSGKPSQSNQDFNKTRSSVILKSSPLEFTEMNEDINDLPKRLHKLITNHNLRVFLKEKEESRSNFFAHKDVASRQAFQTEVNSSKSLFIDDIMVQANLKNSPLNVKSQLLDVDNALSESCEEPNMSFPLDLKKNSQIPRSYGQPSKPQSTSQTTRKVNQTSVIHYACSSQPNMFNHLRTQSPTVKCHESSITQNQTIIDDEKFFSVDCNNNADDEEEGSRKREEQPQNESKECILDGYVFRTLYHSLSLISKTIKRKSFIQGKSDYFRFYLVPHVRKLTNSKPLCPFQEFLKHNISIDIYFLSMDLNISLNCFILKFETFQNVNCAFVIMFPAEELESSFQLGKFTMNFLKTCENLCVLPFNVLAILPIVAVNDEKCLSSRSLFLLFKDLLSNIIFVDLRSKMFQCNSKNVSALILKSDNNNFSNDGHTANVNLMRDEHSFSHSCLRNFTHNVSQNTLSVTEQTDGNEGIFKSTHILFNKLWKDLTTGNVSLLKNLKTLNENSLRDATFCLTYYSFFLHLPKDLKIKSETIFSGFDSLHYKLCLFTHFQCNSASAGNYNASDVRSAMKCPPAETPLPLVNKSLTSAERSQSLLYSSKSYRKSRWDVGMYFVRKISCKNIQNVTKMIDLYWAQPYSMSQILELSFIKLQPWEVKSLSKFKYGVFEIKSVVDCIEAFSTTKKQEQYTVKNIGAKKRLTFPFIQGSVKERRREKDCPVSQKERWNLKVDVTCDEDELRSFLWSDEGGSTILQLKKSENQYDYVGEDPIETIFQILEIKGFQFFEDDFVYQDSLYQSFEDGENDSECKECHVSVKKCVERIGKCVERIHGFVSDNQATTYQQSSCQQTKVKEEEIEVITLSDDDTDCCEDEVMFDVHKAIAEPSELTNLEIFVKDIGEENMPRESEGVTTTISSVGVVEEEYLKKSIPHGSWIHLPSAYKSSRKLRPSFSKTLTSQEQVQDNKGKKAKSRKVHSLSKRRRLAREALGDMHEQEHTIIRKARHRKCFSKSDPHIENQSGGMHRQEVFPGSMSQEIPIEKDSNTNHSKKIDFVKNPHEIGETKTSIASEVRERDKCNEAHHSLKPRNPSLSTHEISSVALITDCENQKIDITTTNVFVKQSNRVLFDDNPNFFCSPQSSHPFQNTLSPRNQNSDGQHQDLHFAELCPAQVKTTLTIEQYMNRTSGTPSNRDPRIRSASDPVTCPCSLQKVDTEAYQNRTKGEPTCGKMCCSNPPLSLNSFPMSTHMSPPCRRCGLPSEKHSNGKCDVSKVLECQNAVRTYIDPDLINHLTSSNMTIEDEVALKRVVEESGVLLYPSGKKFSSVQDPRLNMKIYSQDSNPRPLKRSAQSVGVLSMESLEYFSRKRTRSMSHSEIARQKCMDYLRESSLSPSMGRHE